MNERKRMLHVQRLRIIVSKTDARRISDQVMANKSDVAARSSAADIRLRSHSSGSCCLRTRMNVRATGGGSTGEWREHPQSLPSELQCDSAQKVEAAEDARQH
jgi:hypothetical protein